MGMSFINWIGFVMLVLALLLNELFLGMTAWYELNLGAVVGAIVYLVVGVSLSLWPNPQDQTAWSIVSPPCPEIGRRGSGVSSALSIVNLTALSRTFEGRVLALNALSPKWFRIVLISFISTINRAAATESHSAFVPLDLLTEL
jgi:hypothetical protein